MAGDLDECFFDILLRTLNYSMEFANEASYASLRFMDLFSSLLRLPLIKDLSRNEFYERLGEKIKDRQLVKDPEARPRLQSELLQMFIDEWKRGASQK